MPVYTLPTDYGCECSYSPLTVVQKWERVEFALSHSTVDRSFSLSLSFLYCDYYPFVQREFNRRSLALSLFSLWYWLLYFCRERKSARQSLSLSRERESAALVHSLYSEEREQSSSSSTVALSHPFSPLTHCSTEMRESRVCAVTLNRPSLFLSLSLSCTVITIPL